MGLKTIFHIDESAKWSLLLKNAANLVQMADMETASIEVLANAEAVREYAAGEDTAHIAQMRRLADQGVLFTACSNALKAYRIEPERLIPFVTIVPAGVLELTQRQMQGYAYIKP
ncbi:MAG: DsrE family protein [Bacillota bacterium]